MSGPDPARVLADLNRPLRDAETAVAHAQITAGDDTTRRHLSVAAHALREVRDRLASTGTTTTTEGENDE